MWSYKRFVESKVFEVDCIFGGRPIPFMAFLFFHLHCIEMSVYGLMLNQHVIELCLVQLVNC